ncbi:MAG: glycoside hydrolase family 3 C-terminal domain-containing protein, partial [Bacteroides sp.]
KSIAVIGPLAHDKKSLTSRYGSIEPELITGLEGLENYFKGTNVQIKYAKGCAVRDTHFPESDIMYFPLSEEEKSEINEAVELAQSSDVAIVYVGDDFRTIGESRTRVNLDLSGRQKELVRAVHATGTPTILVLFNGRPVTLNWENENLAAIVEAWYPGEFSGQAVAEVLFGDYNPGGKLSVSFPKSVGQIPWAFPFKHNTKGRGFARVDGGLYPFGYGLSYTSFELKDLKLKKSTVNKDEPLIVSCTLKNTGERTGDEVVQVYLMDAVSSISRYEKELCGFQRVKLAPQEEQTLEFTIDPRSYGFYNNDNQFVTEPGKFMLYLGNSSENTPLSCEFYVE